MKRTVQNIEWEAVPGTDVRLHTIYHHADLTSCNSYILRTPDGDTVIDPGGRPDQVEKILKVLESEKRETKPVFIILTHCHYDHARCLSLLTERLLRPHCTFCHRCGVEVLRQEGHRHTMSFLYADAIPSTEITVPLFGDAPVIPELTVPKEVMIGNCRHDIQQLDIGGEMPLSIFQAHGHSPDSICIQLGEILFAGDLLFAHQPAIAGLPGWSRSDLIDSLNAMGNLVEQHRISVIYGGHGNPLDAQTALRILASAAKTLRDLPALIPLDESRSVFLQHCATLFMRELDFQLAAQGGRFQRLALELSALEEEAFAQQLLDELQLDVYDDFMREFHAFATNPDNLLMQTALPIRGLKIMRNIGKILRKTELPPEIGAHSFFRIEVMLKSYLNLMMGLDLSLFFKPLDLADMIETCVRDLSFAGVDEQALYELAERKESFVLYLARCIDAGNRCRDVVFLPHDNPSTVICYSEPDHLQAVLYDLIELLMSRRERTVYVSVCSSEKGPECLFYTTPETVLSSQKATFYELFFSLLGATFEIDPDQRIRIQWPSVEGEEDPVGGNG